MGDLAVSIPAGEEYVVGPLESARFRNMSTGSGGIVLGATQSISVAIIDL